MKAMLLRVSVIMSAVLCLLFDMRAVVIQPCEKESTPLTDTSDTYRGVHGGLTARCLGPVAAKQAQNISLPLPCLTVMWCFTMIFCI